MGLDRKQTGMPLLERGFAARDPKRRHPGLLRGSSETEDGPIAFAPAGSDFAISVEKFVADALAA